MNNNDLIKIRLGLLEKPNITESNKSNKFNKSDNKECIICLEDVIDLELNQIVRLPCSCANSIYHIECLSKFILIDLNKNFCQQSSTMYSLQLRHWCTHCKTKYELPVNKNNISNEEIERIHQNVDEILEHEIKANICFFVIHVLLNSALNIICANSTDYDIFTSKFVKNNIYKKILVCSYIFKIFLNVGLIYLVKKIPCKTRYIHIFSILLQISILIFSLCVFTTYIKLSKFSFIIYILLNLFFSVIDIGIYFFKNN